MASFELLNAPSPWNWIGQTTLCLLIGVVASVVWAKRPARAHRVLLLAMFAALATPLVSCIVRQFDWGLFSRTSVLLGADQAADRMEPDLGSDDFAFVDGLAAGGFPFAQEGDRARVAAGAPEATPDSPSAASVSPAPIFVWVWAILSAVLVARLMPALFRGGRLLAHARPLKDERIERAVAAAVARLGIQARPLLCTSDVVRCPVIWCWKNRPVLLLPRSATTTSACLDWEDIMCHELAHWKRRDHLTGLFAELLVCLLPWQPLAWWAKRCLAELSERSCDDWALAGGRAATTYAESLLNLLPQRPTAVALAAVSSKSHLLIRVRHILQDRPRDPRPGRLWVGGATLSTLMVVAAVALAQTRNTTAQAPDGPMPAAAAPVQEAAKSATPTAPSQAPVAATEELPKTLTVDLGDSVTMELVLIPKGKFVMGSPQDEKQRVDTEQQHEVEITTPFYMGKYHVTHGQFAAFVKATKYETEAEATNGGYGWNEDKGGFEWAKKYSWRNPGFEQTDAHPVVTVTWNDAHRFCRWLAEDAGIQRQIQAKVGKKVTIRLPSEAEWEYAYRAGSKTRFFFGEDQEELAKYGNVGDANLLEKLPTRTTIRTIRAKDGYVFTSPVGTFLPNEFGLFDMYGNAWQLCEDYFDKDYYADCPDKDPLNLKQSEENLVVMRGGCFYDVPWFYRAARRNWIGATNRFQSVGFRVAFGTSL